MFVILIVDLKTNYFISQCVYLDTCFVACVVVIYFSFVVGGVYSNL